MDYKTFQEQMVRALLEKDENMEVKQERVTKLNGVELDALVISRKGDWIAPTVYPDQLYEIWLRGVPLPQIVQKVLRQYCEVAAEAKRTGDAAFFTEWSRAAPHLYCELVQEESNRGLLQEVPYQHFLDLAVICYYQLPQETGQNATIQIRKEHCKIWQIREEELFRTAWKNTLRDLPVRTANLLIYLKEEYGVAIPEEELGIFGKDLYLVSNRRGCLGAICICYPDVLKDLAQKLEANLYVIPCSIHECMVFPDDGAFAREELSDMVRAVNRDMVRKQEILSDHMYYYDRETEKLSL